MLEKRVNVYNHNQLKFSTMDNKEKVTVQMTEDELQELEELRAIKAQKDAQQKRDAEISEYKKLVDSVIGESVERAKALNAQMRDVKNEIYDSFRSVIDLKNELFKGQKVLKDGRFTDTFTNSDGTKRITLGYNTLDNYDDTYTAGIDMVHQYIESLASDDNSRTLASMVDTLLRERSKAGQLKAQNVLRLEKMASESGSEVFIEGMRIIREAYNPIKTKQFVKVAEKNPETNEWVPVELNMTDC